MIFFKHAVSPQRVSVHFSLCPKTYTAHNIYRQLQIGVCVCLNGAVGFDSCPPAPVTAGTEHCFYFSANVVSITIHCPFECLKPS